MKVSPFLSSVSSIFFTFCSGPRITRVCGRISTVSTFTSGQLALYSVEERAFLEPGRGRPIINGIAAIGFILD